MRMMMVVGWGGGMYGVAPDASVGVGLGDGSQVVGVLEGGGLVLGAPLVVGCDAAGGEAGVGGGEEEEGCGEDREEGFEGEQHFKEGRVMKSVEGV